MTAPTFPLPPLPEDDPDLAPPAGRGGDGAPSGIRQLAEAELGAWKHGRSGENARWLRHPKEDLYGLALSGGGIRSATFNLGLLQALDRVGLLRHFHYLSTVSGGGYTGGWWTRWRDWQVRRRPAGFERVLPRLTAGDPPFDAESREVRHLREYSNFLTPQVGVFSWDTGRMVVSVLAAMVPSLLVATAVLLLGVYAFLAAAWAMAGGLAVAPTPAVLVPLLGVPAAWLVWRLRRNLPRVSGGRLAATLQRPARSPSRRRFARLAASSVLWLLGAGLVLAAVFGTGWAIVGAPDVPWLPGEALSRPLVRLVPPAWLAALLVTGGTLAGFEVVWRRRGEPRDRYAYLSAAVLAAALASLSWSTLVEGYSAGGGWAGWTPPAQVAVVDAAVVGGAPSAGADQREARFSAAVLKHARSHAYLYRPAFAWLAVVLVFVAIRTLTSQAMTSIRRRRLRSAFDRVQARVTFLAAAWTIGVTLWIAGAALAVLATARTGFQAELAFGGVTGVLTLAFGLVQRRAARTRLPAAAASLKAKLTPLLPQLLAYAVLALVVVGLMAVVQGLALGGSAHLVPVLFAAAVVVVGGTLFVFNPNEVGLHGFYRSRLVRAFAGACNTEYAGKTEECPDDDLPMSSIRVPAHGPRVHLVCCAANDLDSATAMEMLNRGATSATLSRVGLSVGDRHCRWSEYRGTVPTLGAAMTASGAAFNTLLGWRSVRLGPGVTFLLAALNLRLGLWLRHPRPGRGSRSERPWHRLPGFPYFKEMLSSVSANDPLVHLSDGGHFENLAAYELIRRHCRVIVVSDCGQDGATEFEDLGRLCRLVRADFGVDIRIDLSPLRPSADGHARQHMVAGDIHYPDGDSGVLLYFKPVLVGSEPTDVLHYRARNADFPHETTVDQFYDEAQWESYRRLGEHAGMCAFRTVTEEGEAATRKAAAEIFGRARREWQAAREGLDAGLGQFHSGSAELDRQLRLPQNRVLLGQVYPELAGDRVQVHRVYRQAGSDDAGASGHVAPASDAEIVESEFFTLRQMLLLLQELFESERLEANHGHSAYLGVINYFRRWTVTERMGFWLPLLKPHFPSPLIRFVERRLGAGRLTPPRAGVHVGPLPDGVDLLRGREPEPREGEVMLSFWVWPGGEAARARGLRMARLLARRSSASRNGGKPKRLAWSAAEFEVADGFWGVGIGQQFLAALSQGVAGLGPIRYLYVRLQSPASAGAGAKQALATDMQLYRSAGFRELDEPRVEAVLNRWFGSAAGDPSAGQARDGGGVEESGPIVHWMRLRVRAMPVAPDEPGTTEASLAAPVG